MASTGLFQVNGALAQSRDKVLARTDVELLKQQAHLGGDRAHRNAQFGRDFGVAQTTRQQNGNVFLPRAGAQGH